MAMDSQMSHVDLVNISKPHSKPPSMAPEAAAPRPPVRAKKQAPQAGINDFWDKFTTKHPGKIFTILPDNLYAKRAAAHAPRGSIPGQNALASYDEAVNACRIKVNKIVKECRRLNQKYRDPHFDIEFDFKRHQVSPEIPPDCLTMLNEDSTTFQPQSVKRVEDIFDKPRFFIEGATANDVRQGNDGDCWFMSALATISNKDGLIQRVCVAQDEEVGVYGFVFHRDGEWISEVIDDKLYLIKEDFDDATLGRHQWLELQNRKSPEEEYRTVMQTGSRALYFAQCRDPNETWLPLLEKAYAKSHGDYSAIDGGFVGEGIEDLTGGVTSEVFATDILNKEKFWQEELLNVNQTFLFGCGQMNGIYGERSGIQEKHAYSIMEACEIDGQRLLKLRNPWGRTEWTGRWSDGSEEWTPEWMLKLNHRFGDDGVFWISYEDLLRHYQHFDRTRLFGPEWTVSQQWTSVDVPWSVDYLDTKFHIHLSKPSPVVIVLSQLDDRYFGGLEGQYEFHLQFRLHKDDEEDYIVRSNGPYYMKRSVSTELDLEAGNYTVLLKIKATRFPNPTPEEVIRATCNKRREKLLSIGLSYDLAHAKGQFREQEKAKARREREQKIERKKAEMKHSHELRQKLKRKEQLRQAKKAAKQSRKKQTIEKVEKKLQDLTGLGINVEDERILGDEENKPQHPAVARHQRAASTGQVDSSRERSSSPSGGFGGRGGYNRGRDGYNTIPGRDGHTSSMAEAVAIIRNQSERSSSPSGGYGGRGGYNRDRDSNTAPGTAHSRTAHSQEMTSMGEALASPPSQGYGGRGGYNAAGRDGYNAGGRDTSVGEALASPPSQGYGGRGGYNAAGRDGYNAGGRDTSVGEALASPPSQGYGGRGGYNAGGRDGYNAGGRDGYNAGGRDGYNETQTDSPIPTPLSDEFRPGTPAQRPYSPRQDRRPTQASPTPSRRPTLSPIPGLRPGISVTRGRDQGISACSNRARQGVYSPNEYSDDSTWDSELDGPDSCDSGFEDFEDELPRFYGRGARPRFDDEEEDEFERDPWNAVCVVGLRVFSKDTDVTIDVHNSEGEQKSNGDDGSVTSTQGIARRQTALDVDDSAADATSPLRTRNNLEIALAERVRLDNAPAEV